MNTAHVDCPTGASGEMWLGAVIHAGASLEAITDAVGRLGRGDVRLTVGRVRRGGLDAVSARVRPPEGTPGPTTWPAVRSILEEADLPAGVRDRGHAVLRTHFEAEAAGGSIDDVNLPAFGGLDVLGVVVGTCAGLVDLGIERLTARPDGPGFRDLETSAGRALLTALTTPGPPPAPEEVERIGIGAGEDDLLHAPHVLRLLVLRLPRLPPPLSRPEGDPS